MGDIEYCMVNSFDRDENGERYPARLEGDIDLLRPDLFADPLCTRKTEDLLSGLRALKHTFSNWLKATDRYFEMTANSCCSISRLLKGSLDYRQGVSFQAAEEQYRKLLESHVTFRDVRALADYMFYYIADKAAEYKLPLKEIFAG